MLKYLVIILFFCIGFISCNGGKSDLNDDIMSDTSLTIEALNKKIRDNPKNPDLFIKRSELYLREDNLDEAINDLELALKVDTTKEDVYSRLSELYLLKGKSDKARDVLKLCIARYPFNAQARLNIARIYFYVQMYKEAMQEIVNLENNNLQSADSYFVKGLILNETEAFDEAIRALRKTIEFDNDHWEAYNLLGMIYVRQNNPLAVEYFTTAIRLFPNNLEIRFNAGYVFQEFKITNKAIEEYEYVISKDSAYFQAYYNLGYVHVNLTGDYEQALHNFTKAIQCDTSSYTAYYNRAYTYEMMGNYKLAELDYRKTLKIMPNYDLAVEGLNDVVNRLR